MSESNITTEPGDSKDLPREEDKVESLSSDRGGRGSRVYHTLLTKALNEGWPIPDMGKARAVLTAMRDLSHNSPRVRAAAIRNLALLDNINQRIKDREQRAEAISKLTETPLLTIEAILANSEALAQERRLLAQERASVNGPEAETDDIPPIGLG